MEVGTVVETTERVGLVAPRAPWTDLDLRFLGDLRLLDIGLDLDGVVFPWRDNMAAWVTLCSGRVLTFGDEHGDDALNSPLGGLSADEFDGYFAAGVSAGFIFGASAPIAGAVEMVQALVGEGHRVHIRTHRDVFGLGAVAEATTRDWLDRYQMPYATLTLDKDKTGRHVDCFLEDNPRNYDELDAAGCTPVLFSQPWNRKHRGRRVQTHWQFVEFVAALAATDR